jgi:hypothetical protein
MRILVEERKYALSAKGPAAPRVHPLHPRGGGGARFTSRSRAGLPRGGPHSARGRLGQPERDHRPRPRLLSRPTNSLVFVPSSRG